MVNKLHEVLHGFTVGAVIVGVLVLGVAAQTPRYEFDVVSIKKRVEPVGLPPPRTVIQGGRFSMPNVTVAGLMQYAWGIRDFRIVDGPEWMWSDRFEVEARALSDLPSPDEVRLMVQSTLEDRFGLAVHWEQRELPYYDLVLARTDGRLGPYLRAADCENAETRFRRPNVYEETGGGTESSGCRPLSEFARILSTSLDLPVMDATGLDGTFDYFLFIPWTMTREQLRSVANPFKFPVRTVMGAMEKELGLTLKATRGPVDVLVIDALGQPTEN